MTAALFAAKLALGPVLLPQGMWVRRKALRMPEAAGPREGRAGEGDEKMRLVVIGDSSAAGVGVDHQSRALAWPLADEVGRRVGGAVRWQLLAQTGISSSDAVEFVSQSRRHRADVAVIVLGVNDVTSQTPAPQFVANLEKLVRVVGVRRAVFAGLPPMHLLSAVPHPLRWYLGRYSAWLDGALRDWCKAQDLGYCASDWASDPRLLADDGYHPGPKLYPQWAARLAEVVVR